MEVLYIAWYNEKWQGHSRQFGIGCVCEAKSYGNAVGHVPPCARIASISAFRSCSFLSCSALA